MRRFFIYTMAALIIAVALIMAGCEEAQAMPTAAGASLSSSKTALSRAASAGRGLESSSETESSSGARSSDGASEAQSSDGATVENTTEEYIQEPSRQAAQEPETPSEIQETAQAATSSQEQETATRSDIQETQPPEPVAISDIPETSSTSSNIQEQKLEPAAISDIQETPSTSSKIQEQKLEPTPSNQSATGWQPGNGPEGADGLPSTGPVEETPSGGSNGNPGYKTDEEVFAEYVGKPEPSGTKGNQMMKNWPGDVKWDSSIGGWRTDNGAIIYPGGGMDITNVGK